MKDSKRSTAKPKAVITFATHMGGVGKTYVCLQQYNFNLYKEKLTNGLYKL